MNNLDPLFESSGFLPHGHCFLWTPALLWSYTLSDGLIALSYFSIPAALWYFTQRRRDVPFGGIFIMFSGFILACGTTHLIAIWNIWQPVYWFDASVKMATATISVATAVMLWPLLPKAIALPSGDQLEQANRKLEGANRELEAEIARRIQIEDELQQANRRLEERVAARTAELEAVNRDLRTSELAFRHSEERLREVIEAVLPGLIVVNGEGTIELVNRQLESMFGYTRDELVGKSVTCLMPERYRRGHPALFAGFLADPVARAMAARQELYGQRKDGIEFPIEIGLNPIDSSEGVQVLAAITDITERKRSEQALRASEAAFRRSEERSREVIEAVLHGLVVVNGEGRIELVNRQLEHMFGYSRVELAGQPIERLMPERYRDGHGSLFSSFLASPSVRTMGGRRDLYGVRKDGTEFPLEIGLNPVRSTEGQQVLATITDVTERKAAREQIERSLVEKTALLNEVHHRVKNNLQVISSLLKMQARNSPPQVEAVLAESYSRVRAMSLIHQLLYEHGDLARVRLGVYLQRLVSLLRDTYNDLRKTVDIQLIGADAELYLDLQQAIPCGLIVTELITNCFKHAFPDGRQGTITVRLDEPEPGTGRLVVSDDGVGIPESVVLGEGRSLGFRLLPTLAEQVGGRLALIRENGVRYELSFRFSHHSEPGDAERTHPDRRG
jgi:PAS domain S-box-containing protein